jgi:hypothetical protein
MMLDENTDVVIIQINLPGISYITNLLLYGSLWTPYSNHQELESMAFSRTRTC